MRTKFMKITSPHLIAFGSVILSISFISTLRAQTELNLPYVSQKALIQQRIGVTDITVSYHRPLVNGRKIWDGLVPVGKVWRAGANENTTIEFSTPVSVEGKPLPAGKYGLHMIPTSDSWTIIFSKMAVAWGSYTYSEAEDALRLNVKPRTNEMEEALEYEFEDLKPDSVAVTMKWEKLAVPFRVAVNETETVLSSIRNELRGHAQYTWVPLNEAAQYCLSKKVNLEEGLKWAGKSIENEERFENLMTKADLLKALNKPDEAKTARSKAMEKADGDQLYSYARGMQREKREGEAMEIFTIVVKRFPESMGGHLAQARLKSAAGDFAAASEAVKKAQSAAPTEEQKASLQPLLEKLQAKRDINK